jgi:hypothetical protein
MSKDGRAVAKKNGSAQKIPRSLSFVLKCSAGFYASW